MARIAYISSTFPNYKSCGVGIYAGYLTKALAEEGHDVHVVTTAIPEIKSTFGNVTVHKILETWTLSEIPKLSRLFNQIKPDIIHINHPTSIAGKKIKILVNILPEINKLLWKLPLVTTIHEFNNVSLLGKLKLIPLIIGSDSITATNQRYAEEIRKFNPLIKNKVQVVNIGCAFDEDLPPSHKEKERKKWGLTMGDKVIGFVGFLTPPKGFHNLLTAVAPLIQKDPSIKVLALSSWNLSSSLYREKILGQIARANISSNIIFSDFLEDADLWAAMEAIDLCVFPFDEPVEERSSAALRQVLFRGLPTIVSAQNLGYSEYGLAHRKNIWLTPLKNIETLRSDILTVLDDSQIRKQLSLGTLDLKEQLSFKGISKSMGQVYSRLLKDQSHYRN